MRIVYLDEAGISNPAQEPYLVVAGVIVHADLDTARITKVLESLAREYGLRWINSFHAKDIWHGTRLFDRNDPKWPLPRRIELLSKLASLPKMLGLPVAIGHVHRPAYKRASNEFHERIARELNRKLELPNAAADQMGAHAEAFVKAAKAVDSWMQKNAQKERAMLIAEDAPTIKRDLKIIQSILQSRDMDIHFLTTESFKTEHIIETVHFAGKTESPFLQLADTCAFVAKRKLMRKPDIDQIYALIEPQIIRLRRENEPFRIDPYYGREEDE